MSTKETQRKWRYPHYMRQGAWTSILSFGVLVYSVIHHIRSEITCVSMVARKVQILLKICSIRLLVACTASPSSVLLKIDGSFLSNLDTMHQEYYHSSDFTVIQTLSIKYLGHNILAVRLRLAIIIGACICHSLRSPTVILDSEARANDCNYAPYESVCPVKAQAYRNLHLEDEFYLDTQDDLYTQDVC